MIDALHQLIADNLIIQAQFNALKHVTMASLLIWLKDFPETQRLKIRSDFQNQYRKLVQEHYQELVSSHPYLDAAWRKQLKEQLGDAVVLFPET